MAFIAEKLEKPVVERLDLTRHYITFDCDFPCYIVLNPSSADCLEGSDVVQVPVGAWQVDAWKFLVKEDFPNRAGFSAVFVYDEKKIIPPDTGRPETRYSDIDIAHMVSGLRGQPVNITQFSCTEAMPVQITTPDKEPLSVSSQGVMYNPATTFDSEEHLLNVLGLARRLSDTEKAELQKIPPSMVYDTTENIYDIDLSRLSLGVSLSPYSLRLFPSGVGSLVISSDSGFAPSIPFVPNRLLLSYGIDKGSIELLESDIEDLDVSISEQEQEIVTASGFVEVVQEKIANYSWEDFLLEKRRACIEPLLYCCSNPVPGGYLRLPVLIRRPSSFSVRNENESYWMFIDGLADSIKNSISNAANLGGACTWSTVYRFSYVDQSFFDEAFARYVMSPDGYDQFFNDTWVYSSPDCNIDTYRNNISKYSNDAWEKIQEYKRYEAMTPATGAQVYSGELASAQARVRQAQGLIADFTAQKAEKQERIQELSNTPILRRLSLLYCYPYTAFKQNPTGQTKVFTLGFAYNYQPDMIGSIQ